MRVSISQVKLFKSCRRAYELCYNEGLVPIETSDALQTGTNYHELIEWINVHGTLDGVEKDNSKELAMANAYMKYIYPLINVKSAEEWFNYKLSSGDELFGRVDGVSADDCLVEYKTAGSDITEAYEYNLIWDEQILAYMLAYGVNKMYYIICRKPTIRQKKDETDEEFYDRMVEWYDTDTESKIRLLLIERTNEEINRFEYELQEVIDEMKTTKSYYKCTNYCNVWGKRCEYSSVCLNYDPEQQYIEFEKRNRR